MSLICTVGKPPSHNLELNIARNLELAVTKTILWA